MAIKHLLAGVATAGLLAGAPAFADDETTTMEMGTFDTYDANQDGFVDESEWRDFRTDSGDDMTDETVGWDVNQWDLDRDDRLDAEEWGAYEESHMVDPGAGVANDPGNTDAGGDVGADGAEASGGGLSNEGAAAGAEGGDAGADQGSAE